MPRGDKSKYTDKQKRQAEHIEQGYEARGTDEQEAHARAWATVNKMEHGGREPGGGGCGKQSNTEPAKKGGRLGGKATASRPKKARAASAHKAGASPESPGQQKVSDSRRPGLCATAGPQSLGRARCSCAIREL